MYGSAGIYYYINQLTWTESMLHKNITVSVCHSRGWTADITRILSFMI